MTNDQKMYILRTLILNLESATGYSAREYIIAELPQVTPTETDSVDQTCRF